MVGLKPGMSAEVEIVMAVHEDILTIPVAAVVETKDGDFCWVQTDEGPQRRSLQLGDSNDVFIAVESGVKEGDEVVLNPMAFIKEAQSDALTILEESGMRESKEAGSEATASEDTASEATESTPESVSPESSDVSQPQESAGTQ